MANKSKIEWTDATWNPVAGCSIVSPGCKNCYAMRTANRFAGIKGHKYEGTARSVNGLPVWTGKINLIEKDLQIPLRWREPRRIFVNSMSDLFHDEVPFDFIDKVFAVMALCPQHTFQILTKRPERMAEYLLTTWQIPRHMLLPGHENARETREDRVKNAAFHQLLGKLGDEERFWAKDESAIHTAAQWPLPNVWLGTSVEDQKRANERISHLLKCPAAIRFISQEPQLGPVKYREEWLAPAFSADDPRFYEPGGRGVDWIIIGGESGPGARPFNIQWASSTIDQCGDFGVACFVKQLGANIVTDNANIHDWPEGTKLLGQGEGFAAARAILKDKKGGDWNEWPPELRIRQFPEIPTSIRA